MVGDRDGSKREGVAPAKRRRRICGKKVDAFSGKVTLVTRQSVRMAFLFPPKSVLWVSILTV